MAKFGCLLIVLAVVALLAIVVIPVLPFLKTSPEVDSWLNPLLCQSGETIEREPYSFGNSRGGTTFSMSVYCLQSEGSKREVTDRWMLIGMGGFAIPFLIGLFLFIGGVGRRVTKMVSPGAAFVSGLGSPAIRIEGLNLAGAASDSTLSLSERLKQLQAARDAGLITVDEYERLRQKILDGSV